MKLEIVYILTLSYAQFEEEYSCTVGFTTSAKAKNKRLGNPKPLDFTGDRERIRTAGLPLRSVKRTTKNIERTAFLGYSF